MKKELSPIVLVIIGNISAILSRVTAGMIFELIAWITLVAGFGGLFSKKIKSKFLAYFLAIVATLANQILFGLILPYN